MNFFPFPSNTQTLKPNVGPFQQLVPIELKPSILNIIAVALTMDFTRFENKIRNQIILEELKNKANSQAQEKKRSLSLQQPQKPSISASQSVPKPTQKVPGPKTTAPAKTQKPKNVVVTSTQTKPQAPVKNEVKVEMTPKVQVVKHKKKIHKIQEVRKQNPKRQLEVCLLDAAESPRWRLTQKEKKRIRERLIMRQVYQWDRPNQQKRDRRDLRAQN